MGVDDEKRLSYLPTDGLSYDPADPVYWDAGALGKETTRVFEVCHGCRMCFKYCDTFPSLFALVDDVHDGDVRRITETEKDRILDTCYQCKLCEVQCPYTPRDGHEFQLDFPKLVHRHAAVRVRERGLDRRARLLGDPDKAAALARASLGLANKLNRTRMHRVFLEKLAGIHREKDLPDFAAETFETWARRSGRIGAEPGGEAVLFQTCYVQHNEPEIGRDTVEVLEHNGIDLRCAAGFQCCGMPAWEHGDLERLRSQARANLDRLAPFVEKGAKVAVINPTCSMMLRREYPELVAPEDRVRATQVAEAVVDPSELLWSIRSEERFRSDFRSSPQGRVAYHAPCHLRAQAVGFKGRDLLRKLPGVERVATVMECCGHDGTYAMKVEGFEPSKRLGEKAFAGMREAEGEVWSTDCPLAALQFGQHAGRRPMHPMTILARAYRGDSFGPDAPGAPRAEAKEEPREEP